MKTYRKPNPQPCFNRIRLSRCIVLLALLALSLVVEMQVAFADNVESSKSQFDVLVVVGAEGEEEFGDAFQRTAQHWQKTCERANLDHHQIGPESPADSTNRDELESTLNSVSQRTSMRPVWIILIGHGTWDGTTARFNLVGPDINAKEMAAWVRGITRPLIIVNGSSSSGPFIERLSGPNRVIVTATKSGSEQNFTRFGEYFASAFHALDADLDHDDSISVREAFLKAVSDTERFYREQDRLATEHALLEDNSDRKGSSSDLVLGKAKTKSGAKVDGDQAGRFTIPATTDAVQLTDDQLATRDRLESQLRSIIRQHSGSEDRSDLRKAALPLLLELAKLYEESTSETTSPPTPAKSEQP